jgi:ABC-type amino acid transport substrate-binding protein
MDDERIERALRLGPPDEPAYLPRGQWPATDAVEDAAAGEAGPTATVSRETGATGTERVRPIGVRVRDARRPSRWSFPMTIAASLALLIGLLLAVQVVPTGPAATPAPSPDLLARLLASGGIGIAVSNGAPQTVAQGGAYIGFDVDVAKAIARQLGMQADVTPLDPNSFAAGSWDLALAGHARQSLTGVLVSEPYAWWPVWLAVPEASSLTDVAGISGARVCVVAGSAGADWLDGRVAGVGGGSAPPGVVPVARASDDACVAAVAAGEADALLTASLLADEVRARGLRPVDPNPVLLDAWTAAVRDPAADASTLLEAVNGAIATLRTSGELADLSRASFGGLDVTGQQP